MNFEKLRQHPFVVLGQEHYNPLGIVRTLGENGIHPTAFVYGGGLRLTSKSKYLKKVYEFESLDEAYDELLKFIGSCEGPKPFILTSDDTTESYLDQRYEELVDRAYFFNAGKAGRVTAFMDKKAILAAAQKHGLKVLDAVVTERGIVPEGLDYPVITKAITPTMGAWKNDMHICHNEDELRVAFDSIRSDEVLVQKYIVKKNELCMEGISSPEGCDMLITIASTYNYYLPMSYSPYMTVGNLKNPELEAKLSELMADIGFTGVFEIEFLEDQEGNLWFGEINFRNSTWSYASTCAGMPLALIWADSQLTGIVDRSLLRKVPDGFTAMVEITDYRERVKKGKVSLGAWLSDFKNADCRYYLGRHGDIAPVVSLLGTSVCRKLHLDR